MLSIANADNPDVRGTGFGGFRLPHAGSWLGATRFEERLGIQGSGFI